jgi:hypothetical protein
MLQNFVDAGSARMQLVFVSKDRIARKKISRKPRNFSHLGAPSGHPML